MRIDVHQHTWPARLRAALLARVEPPYLRADVLTLSAGGASRVDPLAYAPEARLQELDRNGVELALVSCPPTMELPPELIELWHDGALAAAAESGGRLVPLACGESRAGFAGAIVAGRQLEDLDRLAPLLDDLEAHDRLLFVHPGSARPPAGAPSWWSAGIAYTAELQFGYAAWIAAGAARWPQLRVVFALLAGGAPFQVERLVRRGLDPRILFESPVWLETSSYGPRALDVTLSTFGPGRLLFGSDGPVDAMAPALATIAGFGAPVERMLTETNPARLLGLEGERWAA
jgi:predicted TIM-barrel fold metal-dependent hydrolase